MQRLKRGPLAVIAGRAELWLDGGHNPAGGEAIAATLEAMPERPTHLVVGMLNTKDIAGYLRPLAAVAESLHAVSIPGEKNTLPAEDTAEAARAAGIETRISGSVAEALSDIVARAPDARILICGSLYLAGHVLRDNG
jgi:dihydrofolate synthase/folylpolyglutamate synthase